MTQTLHFSTEQKIRLDEFLRQELPARIGQDVSNSKIRRLIVAGAVSVNQRHTQRPSFELRGKSEITVELDLEKLFYEKQPDDIKFEVTPESVLFEDENLIFINKPAFFPVEQTITGNRDNLHDAVVRYLWSKNPKLRNPPYVGIMHRLDRETSGVILFTKTRAINKQISELFQSHSFVKKYLAVVPALLEEGTQFTVEMNMGRISSSTQAAKWGETKDGQYSKTDFKVLSRIIVEDKPCVLIECTLYTGRTHQIRVHLSSKDIPILGDTLYGGLAAERIYLHSCELSSNLFSVKSNCPW
ncbi:MAG: RluA family pseudouridine synthase [Treponema sp.]|nr:RluA family pseudouridine synthase [Treponema sp.]